MWPRPSSLAAAGEPEEEEEEEEEAEEEAGGWRFFGNFFSLAPPREEALPLSAASGVDSAIGR